MAYTRIELDLPEDAANRFAFLLAEMNAGPGEKYTPSELAASLLIAVLEDDYAADKPVDLRSLDS